MDSLLPSTTTLLAPSPVRRPRWIYPAADAGPASARAVALARDARISPLLAALLLRRGIDGVEGVRSFLEPALAHLHDPMLLPDMGLAVARLDAAIAAGDPVLLYSDYDVDGNTGAAILFDILGRLGAKVSVHVPDREKDGYGLKIERLRRAHAEGIKVVISIDNGVTAVAEAAFCREVGLDLIITDHHTMKAELPQALAVIHPRVPGSRYPNPHICGAGVAFKLAWAIAQHRGHAGANGTKKPSPELRERLLAGLALVALGTVADVVALQGENRALVRFGLKTLALGPTPGLRALLGVADAERAQRSNEKVVLDATHIGFQLAPRLNAAGRMGDASRAYRLLAATTDAEAQALAAELDRENSRRRSLQKETTDSVRAEVERVYGREIMAPGLVVAGEGWKLGVVGIVAAKVVEDTRRPALVLSVTTTAEGQLAKGSGRSVPGVDLLRCLDRCKDLLETYGGHAAACGLTIKHERLEAFREAWTASVAAELALDGGSGDSTVGEHTLEIDLEVELKDVHQALLVDLSLLEPFGQGNRAPLLAAREVELAGEPKPMGQRGEHCSFFVRQGAGPGLRAVAFGKPELLDILRARAVNRLGRERFELAFRPKLNRWNGQTSVELEVVDVRFAKDPS
jgi:single-stranded-DNA-specific exonuclease